MGVNAKLDAIHNMVDVGLDKIQCVTSPESVTLHDTVHSAPTYPVNTMETIPEVHAEMYVAANMTNMSAVQDLHRQNQALIEEVRRLNARQGPQRNTHSPYQLVGSPETPTPKMHDEDVYICDDTEVFGAAKTLNDIDRDRNLDINRDITRDIDSKTLSEQLHRMQRMRRMDKDNLDLLSSHRSSSASSICSLGNVHSITTNITNPTTPSSARSSMQSSSRSLLSIDEHLERWNHSKHGLFYNK